MIRAIQIFLFLKSSLYLNLILESVKKAKMCGSYTLINNLPDVDYVEI